MKKILYETDLEHDFALREGALFVKGNDKPTPQPYGAEKIIPNVYALHGHAQKNGWIISGSSDRHFYEDVELVRNAGGAFDDHCMNGTWGQLRLRGLEPQKDIYIQSKEGPMLEIKRYTPDQLKEFIDRAKQGRAHLIFEKQSYDVGTNPNFELAMTILLEELDKEGEEPIEFYLDGLATDYCNKAALLKIANIRDKYKKRMGLYVITDAIEAVNINFLGQVDADFGKKALEEMVAAGAKLITTKDVLEMRI